MKQKAKNDLAKEVFKLTKNDLQVYIYTNYLIFQLSYLQKILGLLLETFSYNVISHYFRKSYSPGRQLSGF